jgi:hypothetical protein
MVRPGEFAKPSDAELPPDLAELIQFYRAKAFHCPPRDNKESSLTRSDVRETLEDLVKLPRSTTDKEAANIYRHLDSWTSAGLLEAARMARLKLDLINPEGFAKLLPKLAARAHREMAKKSDLGGTPAMRGVYILFAEALAKYYQRKKTIIPAADSAVPSAYKIWAEEMFNRANFHTEDLYNILREGMSRATC